VRQVAAGATIGFFDSGVGGLSVWWAVHRRLPDCSTLYVADNAHCPYGPRPAEQVRRYSAGITRFLLAQGADLIVVACNTASAAALQWLRAHFATPFVGMEPAVKPAAQVTRTGHVGVLATQGTVEGDLFRNTSARHANGVVVHTHVGDGLVECVEAGRANAPEAEQLLRHYVDPMLKAGVDCLVLGCTHYSFLIPALQRILPDTVTVVDAAEAVARQVERRLLEVTAAQPRLVRSGEPDDPAITARHRFFTTGTSDVLATLLRTELHTMPEVQRLAWRNGQLHLIEGSYEDR
jgi:glutamate racemase